MKKLLVFGLLLVLVCVLPLGALAQTALTFEKGQELLLFDQDGVKLTLNGKVEDNGMMSLQLGAVVENKTNKTIQVTFHGSCNGWTVNRSVMGGGGGSVAPNAKAKGYVWLNYEDLDIARFSDLTEATLTFTVSNDNSGEVLFTVPDVHIVFGDGQAQPPEPTYFEECPLLPDPTAYGAMYQASRSGGIMINGIQSSSTRYTYRSSRSDDLRAAYDEYISAIRSMGFTVTGAGTSHTIFYGGEKVAAASFDDVIIVEIMPGGEKLGSNTGSTTGSTVQTDTLPRRSIGDTLTTSTMRMKLLSSGVTDIIYSYDGAEPSWYFYITPQDGSRLLYIKGTFTNLGNREVDIENIYTLAVLDGKYEYEGMVTALRPDGKDFTDDVSAQNILTCYIYFEIPEAVVNSYKTCTVKLGFTDSFNTKISNALTGYDFDACDDAFAVELNKNGASSTTGGSTTTGGKTGTSATAKPAATPRATATPSAAAQSVGGEGITFQEIPWGATPNDARSALIKKGYIKNTGAINSFHQILGSMLYSGDPQDPVALPYGYEEVLYEDWIYDTDVQKTIGGYDVASLSLCYRYTIKNGKLNKDAKELISVNVELSAADVETALADLERKLTKLYGPCTESSFFGTVWIGAEDTCLVLYDFGAPTLLYAKTDNLAVVQQMYEELGLTASPDDLDGL